MKTFFSFSFYIEINQWSKIKIINKNKLTYTLKKTISLAILSRSPIKFKSHKMRAFVACWSRFIYLFLFFKRISAICIETPYLERINKIKSQD